MTAEIAIMNRSAVALAADSAVTLETQTTTKTYNTINKLFTLSKYHPVGIMIYQNADFMDIPWETLIKLFRSRLNKTEKATVHEYAKAIINFVHTTLPTPPERQQDRIFGIWYSHFEAVNKEIRRSLIRRTHEQRRSLSENEARDIIKAQLKAERDRLKSIATLPAFTGVTPNDLVNRYRSQFEAARQEQFGGRPLTKQARDYIEEIAGLIIIKDDFSPIMSGVVVAGFGADEYFPSLLHLKTDGIVDDKLIVSEDPYQDISREPKDRARVLAFAQREMVQRFMEGVDHKYLNILEMSMDSLIRRLADELVGRYASGSDAEMARKRGLARRTGSKMLSDLMGRLADLRQGAFVNEVMRAVEVLPKEEMAELAESMVSVTSIKRRMSFDAETVGGPIDVAVISKGDGFVWIKRKHYFDPTFNPHFTTKYFAT